MSEALREDEGIPLRTSVSTRCIIEPKQFYENVGYHNGFDIFDLINNLRLVSATFLNDAPPEACQDHAVMEGSQMTRIGF